MQGVVEKSKRKQVRVVRQARMDDLAQLLELDATVWPDFPANEEMIKSRLEVFPQGQFVATCEDRVVGSIYSQLVNYESLLDSFTWMEITGNGTIRQTHTPSGDSVYGIGLAVLPEFQGTAASRLLIMAVAKMAMRRGRYRFLWGARIPGYHKYKEMPVDQYIKKKTAKGRYIDLELSLYQQYGANPDRPLSNYMPDPESLDFGVLVVADLSVLAQESIEKIDRRQIKATVA